MWIAPRGSGRPGRSQARCGGGSTDSWSAFGGGAERALSHGRSVLSTRRRHVMRQWRSITSCVESQSQRLGTDTCPGGGTHTRLGVVVAVAELLESCLSFVEHRETAVQALCDLVQRRPTLRLSYNNSQDAAELVIGAHENPHR